MTQELKDKIKLCAVYHGYVFVAGSNKEKCDRHYYNMGDGYCSCYKQIDRFYVAGQVQGKNNTIFFEALDYSIKWPKLMKLWSKVLADLEKRELGVRRFEKILNDWKDVCCFHSKDPSKAFDVICEAIELLNKK